MFKNFYHKKSKEPKKARNPFNQEIYEIILSKKNRADQTNNKNASFSYLKVLKSLERYPCPIINGVGCRNMQIMSSTINEKYKEYKIPFDQQIQKRNSTLEDYFSKQSKSKQSKQKINTNKKQYKIRKNTQGYNLLTTLYNLNEQNESNYYNKKQILDAQEHNTLITKTKSSNFTKQTIQKLKDENYIQERDYDYEMKYSLTEFGLKETQKIFEKAKDEEIKLIQKNLEFGQKKIKKKSTKKVVQLTFKTCEISSLDITLKIDQREKERKFEGNSDYFLDKLQSNQLKSEKVMLSIGDFLWTAKVKTIFGKEYEYVLDTIIERKTINDLSCSLKDSRYQEQKTRLMNCGLQNIYYLVEGNLLRVKEENVKSAIQGFQFSTKFKFFNTKDTEETIKFLFKLNKFIKARYTKILKDNEEIKFFKGYDEFKKANRKFQNYTVHNAAYNAVLQIRHIGQETAVKIVKNFLTLSDILEEIDNEDKEQLLTKLLTKKQKEEFFKVFSLKYKTQKSIENFTQDQDQQSQIQKNQMSKFKEKKNNFKDQIEDKTKQNNFLDDIISDSKFYLKDSNKKINNKNKSFEIINSNEKTHNKNMNNSKQIQSKEQKKDQFIIQK